MSPLHEDCVWINGPDPHETTPLKLVLPARAVSWRIYHNHQIEIEFDVMNLPRGLRVNLPIDFRFYLNGLYEKKFNLTLEEVV